MPDSHYTARLTGNSPQVGTQCPVTKAGLKAGDWVVICQISGAAFSLEGYRTFAADWKGECPYCHLTIPAANLQPKDGKGDRRPPKVPDAGSRRITTPWYVVGGALVAVCLLLWGVIWILGQASRNRQINELPSAGLQSDQLRIGAGCGAGTRR